VKLSQKIPLTKTNQRVTANDSSKQQKKNPKQTKTPIILIDDDDDNASKNVRSKRDQNQKKGSQLSQSSFKLTAPSYVSRKRVLEDDQDDDIQIAHDSSTSHPTTNTSSKKSQLLSGWD
jgi:hypothetical protein